MQNNKNETPARPGDWKTIVADCEARHAAKGKPDSWQDVADYIRATYGHNPANPPEATEVVAKPAKAGKPKATEPKDEPQSTTLAVVPPAPETPATTPDLTLNS